MPHAPDERKSDALTVQPYAAPDPEPFNAAAVTALDLTDKGFYCTPLCWPTADGLCGCPKHHRDPREIGKAPLLGDGYQTKKLSDEQVLHIAAMYPDANWALLLELSGLLVSDADSAQADREVEQRGAPPGPRTRTAKGVHRYFRNRSGVIGNTIKRGDSKTLDILATGFVVLPGSRHQSGAIYESEVSFAEVELEDAPQWMIDLLVESKKAQAEVEALPDDLSSIDLTTLNIPPWVKEVILKGQPSTGKQYPSRSEAVFAVVSALLNAGYDTATIAGILLDPQYPISAKPREQGWKWLAGDIARARAKIQEAKEGMNGHDEEAAQQKTEQKKRDLPVIRITTDLTGMVNTLEAALRRLPGPALYQRARQVSRIVRGGPPLKWMTRAADAPVIMPLDTVALCELANQAASFQKYQEREKVWKPFLPHERVIQTLAARLSWNFPVLEASVGAPTLRVDSALIATPGYDPETGLYLDTNGVAFPPVPQRPTLDDARVALAALSDVFTDFPFARGYHQSAALVAALSVVARHAVRGCVPLFAVRSTARGSGKGLLVDTIATIGSGYPAPRWPQVLDEDEERKRLLTVGLDGDACCHIDNVTAPLGSAPLDTALTTGAYKERILGKSQSINVPMTAVFFASGNNMTFKGDTARRVVPIDLDPKMEKPEERSGFQHSPLLDWVRKERPRLVVQALTVLKAYFVADCPKQSGVSEFGSFEPWSDLVRHALIWTGLPDPCEGRKNIEAESDTSYEALAILLECWASCYERPATLKAVLQDIAHRKTPDPSAVTPANEWNALHDALSAFDERFDGKRLDSKRIGNALRRIEGRVLGNRRLIRDGEYQGAAKWRVSPI